MIEDIIAQLIKDGATQREAKMPFKGIQSGQLPKGMKPKDLDLKGADTLKRLEDSKNEQTERYQTVCRLFDCKPNERMPRYVVIIAEYSTGKKSPTKIC